MADRTTENQNPLQAYVDEQLDCYEMRADNGDYTPNDQERALMADFVNGLICDEEFLRLCAADPQCPSPTRTRVCPDSEDGEHILKQDGPFSIVYCDACGMNKGHRTDG